MTFFVTALLIVALLEPVTGYGVPVSTPWSYEGQDQWWRTYPSCGNSQPHPYLSQYQRYLQSPIDIHYNIQSGSNLPSFNLTSYETTDRIQFYLQNDGHTVKMTPMNGVQSPISISEISQPGVYGHPYGVYGSQLVEYELEQVNFHWGSHDFQGSEHTIQGVASPMEMHLVHRRRGYASYTSGPVVLSFLFEISPINNHALDGLLGCFPSVTYSGQMVPVTGFRLSELLPMNAGNGGYYRYTGTLTSPPCTGPVTWTIFEQRIKISSQQLAIFRSLRTGAINQGWNKPLQDNFRRVQHSLQPQIFHKMARPGYYQPTYYNPYRPTVQCQRLLGQPGVPGVPVAWPHPQLPVHGYQTPKPSGDD